MVSRGQQQSSKMNAATLVRCMRLFTAIISLNGVSLNLRSGVLCVASVNRDTLPLHNTAANYPFGANLLESYELLQSSPDVFRTEQSMVKYLCVCIMSVLYCELVGNEASQQDDVVLK